MNRRVISILPFVIAVTIFLLVIGSVRVVSGSAIQGDPLKQGTTTPTPIAKLIPADPSHQGLSISGEKSPQTLAFPTWTKIHPLLLRRLSQNERAGYERIIIEWKREPAIIQKYQALSESITPQTKTQTRSALITELQADAELHTANLMRFLSGAQRKAQAKDIRRFWISPIISLSANPQLILELAQRKDVQSIRPDERIELEPPGSVAPLDKGEIHLGDSATTAWLFNLDMVEVDQVEKLFGLTGEGVVVANIDTGVEFYHPALMKHYRGYNPNGPHIHAGNWYVVTGEPYLYPGDGYGHGTHTMGIMVGDDELGHRIGVAPGAKWIAVKAFTNQGYTYESWLHAAFEWIIAPNGNPALAPDVVNNSWGSSNGGDGRFRQDIAALKAAGIFPVFSAGNNGPQSGTVGSPASYPESLAVGALDSSKLPASFSSRGPSPWAEVKPEISAPGVNILSSYLGGGYTELNGTSMAAPHVAGIAALLLQAQPSLNVDQLEQILLDTAEPIGSPIPNNNTGYGMVNALAATLQVTQYGFLRGAIYDSITLQPVAFPTITVSNRDPFNPFHVTISGDENGEYQLTLIPGFYDATASAFGYAPSTQYSQSITPSQTTNLNFYLESLPKGRLRGRVLDAVSLQPLSATITIEGTPLKVYSHPDSGDYQVFLPGGVYSITFETDAHRIFHHSQIIQAGVSYDLDVYLEPAPHILLVDSGAWYYKSEIGYYQTALRDLDYTYDLWTIRSPYGQNGIPDDRPLTSTLSAYDLVIWSSPFDSPGLLNVGSVISSYLSSGGNILLSGQEIAFLDGGGPSFYPQQPYFEKLLGIYFYEEGYLNPLHGAAHSPFSELYLELNTPDSAQQQLTPDSVQVINDMISRKALIWDDQAVGGAVAETCVPYKAMWWGFGFEGSGPLSNRLSLLDKTLAWFSTPKAPYSFLVHTNQNETIAPPGGILTTTFEIVNNGNLTDQYLLDVNQGSWPVSILLPNGQSFTDNATLSIPSCSMETITATLQIPSDAQRNEGSFFTLAITSQNSPTLSTTLTSTAKTPASVLMVDDQLWYDNLTKFTGAMDSQSIPYDVLKTAGYRTPLTDTVIHYPLMVWTTGYDWYFTLSIEDEKRLTHFLNQGGGLLLSSQDVLDIRGVDSFFQDQMGVIGAKLSVTPTQATRFLDTPLHLPPKSSSLTFPFTNWGDAVIPAQNTIPILHDQNLNTIGLLNAANNQRAAFFSFPLETMNVEQRHTFIPRLLFWLSPVGDTIINLPPAIAAGEDITLEIQLRTSANANPPQPKITRMRVPIPDGINLLPSSVSPGWIYIPEQNSLLWQGELAPGVTQPLSATFHIPQPYLGSNPLIFEAQFFDEKGFLINYRQPVGVDQSYINLSKDWQPREAQPGDTIAFTLTLTNSGGLADTAYLTESLKDGLTLLTTTISTTQGLFSSTDHAFYWQVSLTPGQSARLTYSAQISPTLQGGGIRISSTNTSSRHLYAKTEWSSSYDSWVAYSDIFAPLLIYFPYVGVP